MSDYALKFHKGLISSFYVILLTDRQTPMKTYLLWRKSRTLHKNRLDKSLVEVMMRNVDGRES